MIKAHSLKSNEKIQVVDNISLDIYDQEFVTIVGPSGCGKSTLLSLMAGLSEPDSGQIIYSGKSGDKSNFNLSAFEKLLLQHSVHPSLLTISPLHSLLLLRMDKGFLL